jgi:hypothetical protein
VVLVMEADGTGLTESLSPRGRKGRHTTAKVIKLKDVGKVTPHLPCFGSSSRSASVTRWGLVCSVPVG